MTNQPQNQTRPLLLKVSQALRLTNFNSVREFVLFSLGIFVFYALTYWKFWFVGMLNYIDLTPNHLSPSEQFDTFRSAWVSQNLGGPGSELPGNVLISLLIMSLGNPVSAQKFLYLSWMPLSSITMFLYLNSRIGHVAPKATVSFYYGVNPITIFLFDGGSGLLIPYAVYPMFVWSLEKLFISHRRISDAAATAVLLSLPSFFNPQTPLFYMPTFLVFLIIATGNRNLVGSLRLLGYTMGIFVAVTAVMYSSIWSSLAQVFILHSKEIAYGAAGVQLGSISSRVVGDFLTPVARRNMITFILPLAALSIAGLGIRRKSRLVYFSFLLIPATFLALWWSGFQGYSIWLYTIFPPLAVYGVVKMLAILTESFFVLGVFLIRKAPNRLLLIFQRQTIRIAVMGLVLVLIIGSNLAYQANPDDPNFAAFSLGGVDRTKYSVPQVYYEVRSWLSLDSSQGLARILWLPLDPGTLNIVNAFYLSTPVYFPNTNQTQHIFDILTTQQGYGIGALLADVNVKYVIVNMVPNGGGAIWQHDDPPYLAGYGPAFSFSLYMAGRPADYVQLLSQANDLRLSVVRDDFTVFQNLRYVPSLSAFQRVSFIAPPNETEQSYATNPKNSTNNLIPNADFAKGLDGWSFVGTWVANNNTSSEVNSRYVVASQMPAGWVMAWRSIAIRNTSYYLSGSMATTNVVQSHVRVTYYDSAGQRLRTDFPQSGVDGTHQLMQFRMILLPPYGAVNLTLWLMGGWSQDGIHQGETIFSGIFLSETAGPISDDFRSGFDPAFAISRLSDLPNEYSGIVVAGPPWQDFATSLPQEALGLTQKIFFGGEKNTIDATNSVPLTYVYEAESSLIPSAGKWEITLDPNYSNGAALNGVTYPITGELPFYIVRSDRYIIQFKASPTASWNLTVDGSPVAVRYDENTETGGNSLSWFETNTPIFLVRGAHRIALSTGRNFTLDKIVLRTNSSAVVFLQDNFSARMTHSERYSITLGSSSPVIIVLGTIFNPQWQASNKSAKLTHFPFPLPEYSANAYYWPGGSATIEVLFAGQAQRDLLLIISGSGLLIGLLVILLSLSRRLEIVLSDLFA